MDVQIQLAGGTHFPLTLKTVNNAGAIAAACGEKKGFMGKTTFGQTAMTPRSFLMLTLDLSTTFHLRRERSGSHRDWVEPVDQTGGCGST